MDTHSEYHTDTIAASQDKRQEEVDFWRLGGVLNLHFALGKGLELSVREVERVRKCLFEVWSAQAQPENR